MIRAVSSGMGTSTQGAAWGPVESLDFALAALRQRVHHLLHDEAAPSLCAAGLHLDILAAAAPDDAALQESASSLRTALESALDALRTLLIESDPRLFQRGGLDGALAAFAQAGLILWDQRPTPASWTPAQSELAFRIVRDCALASRLATPPAPPAVRSAGPALQLSSALFLPWSSWLPAWRHLAASAALSLDSPGHAPGLDLTLAPARRPPHA
jgi:hypothetical protein